MADGAISASRGIRASSLLLVLSRLSGASSLPPGVGITTENNSLVNPGARWLLKRYLAHKKPRVPRTLQ